VRVPPRDRFLMRNRSCSGVDSLLTRFKSEEAGVGWWPGHDQQEIAVGQRRSGAVRAAFSMLAPRRGRSLRSRRRRRRGTGVLGRRGRGGIRYRFGPYSGAGDAGDSVDSSSGFEGYSRGTPTRRRLIPVKPPRGTLGQVQAQRRGSNSRYRKRFRGLPRVVESERAHQPCSHGPCSHGGFGPSAGVRWRKEIVH